MKINSQYLDGEYIEKNPSFHVEDSSWKATQILKGLDRNDLDYDSIAEVGCGAGEILVQLSSKLPDSRFIGYELSPQAFEMCKTRENENIKFLDKDIFKDPEVFDLMLCIDVFEHIEDYFDFLRRLSTKSKSFIFHIPLDMNVQMVARSTPILGVRKSVGHLHYFSKDTALATLSHCGFNVCDWFYTPNGVDRPKSLKAKILQAPRKIAQLISLEFSARYLGGYSLLVVAKPSPTGQS
jgi:cyclopropane fatty-acyl-phospholipid synthase-like methyltransferase